MFSVAGIETKFAGSSCNDVVTSDGSGSTIISGHFDKSIRFWDARVESSSNDIVLQGKVTSLDLSRGKLLHQTVGPVFLYLLKAPLHQTSIFWYLHWKVYTKNINIYKYINKRINCAGVKKALWRLYQYTRL